MREARPSVDLSALNKRLDDSRTRTTILSANILDEASQAGRTLDIFFPPQARPTAPRPVLGWKPIPTAKRSDKGGSSTSTVLDAYFRAKEGDGLLLAAYALPNEEVFQDFFRPVAEPARWRDVAATPLAATSLDTFYRGSCKALQCGVKSESIHAARRRFLDLLLGPCGSARAQRCSLNRLLTLYHPDKAPAAGDVQDKIFWCLRHALEILNTPELMGPMYAAGYDQQINRPGPRFIGRWATPIFEQPNIDWLDGNSMLGGAVLRVGRQVQHAATGAGRMFSHPAALACKLFAQDTLHEKICQWRRDLPNLESLTAHEERLAPILARLEDGFLTSSGAGTTLAQWKQMEKEIKNLGAQIPLSMAADWQVLSSRISAARISAVEVYLHDLRADLHMGAQTPQAICVILCSDREQTRYLEAGKGASIANKIYLEASRMLRAAQREGNR